MGFESISFRDWTHQQRVCSGVVFPWLFLSGPVTANLLKKNDIKWRETQKIYNWHRCSFTLSPMVTLGPRPNFKRKWRQSVADVIYTWRRKTGNFKKKCYAIRTLAQIEIGCEIDSLQQLLTTTGLVVNETFQVKDQDWRQLFQSRLSRSFHLLSRFRTHVASQRLLADQTFQSFANWIHLFILNNKKTIYI